MRVALAGTLVVALVAALFVVRPSVVARLDDSVCDGLTALAGTGRSSGEVVIVEIDEAALAAYGRWPWPRATMASLTRRILSRGAATVVLDTTLTGAGPDDELAEAIAGKPVVVGYAFRFDGAGSDPAGCLIQPLSASVAGPDGASRAGFFHPAGALCNTPGIARAAEASGFLNASADSDGKLRSLPLAMEFGDRQYPSLALAAFDLYRHTNAVQFQLNAREASLLRLDSREVRLEGRSLLRLRFRGPRRSFTYFPASIFLNDSAAADLLWGKIVVVGGSALGLPNPVATPADAQLPDVEVQATALDNLLQGDTFHRPLAGYWWELILAAALGTGAVVLASDGAGVQFIWLIAGVALALPVASWLLLLASGDVFSPLPALTALIVPMPVVALLKHRQMKARIASERAAVREMMQAGEARYERLVENINDALVVDDAQGSLLFANRRFREWFELESAALGSYKLEDFAAPGWRSTLRDLRLRRMSGEQVSAHVEYEATRPDGSRLWIEALFTPIIEAGKPVGTQAALRDITERKQIEERFLQAQKMESVGRLAGGVAHDFNNLLQVINGYSGLLLAGELDAGVRDSVEEIRSAGERAAELTRKLLTFSRREQTRPAVVRLNQLVSEAAKMFLRVLGADIEVVTTLSEEAGYIFADAGQIHQILMNLMVNARDAMPNGGRVVIETRNVDPDEDFVRAHPGFKVQPWVYLGVRDTGCGMSDDVKRHLFEPFFTTKETGRGTGLGLATVYGIVRQSSGHIEVESRPGEGAAFHIYLPRVAEREQTPRAAKESARAKKGSETVLLVEDQDAVRRYLRSVLAESGYRILEASNGAEAMKVAEAFAEPIHLLVTDLVMPVMSGRELAVKLHAARPETKILFVSGYAMDAMLEQSSDIPFSCLQKPFSPEQLLARVQETLAAG